MNICIEPKYSFNSKGKTIGCTLGNSPERYNLPNSSSRISYQTKLQLKNLNKFKKELFLKGLYLNNSKNAIGIYYKYNKQNINTLKLDE